MTRFLRATVPAFILIALTVIPGAAQQFASRQDQQSRPPAQGQAPETQPKTAEPAALPEVTALNDALKITDLGKRYTALQKVMDDYPKTEAANVARTQMSRQLWSGLNAQKSAVEYMAKQLAQSSSPSDCNQFAAALLRVDLFLEQAENVAKRGLSIDEATYLAATKEARKAAGTPLTPTSKDGVVVYAPATGGRGGRTPREVSDTDLRDQYKTARASLQATLGEIYARRGKTAEAAATLKEAYATDLPSASKRAVASSLADLAAKAGDTQGELSYRVTAYVLGGASPTARQNLEAAYKKMHDGSTAGLEALLDETYRKSTRAVETKPFVRPATKTPRMVLAELFTGAACPPCVAADMAFDATLERFARQDVAVVVYHQHIPGPDPMTNPATEARKPIYALRGVPTFAIDGKSTVGGGGAGEAEAMFNDDIRPVIERELGVAPEARIDVKASLVGSTIRVQATVSDVKRASGQMKLQIALVEELQRYSGPNGIRFHPMVVRSLGGPDFKGFAVTAKGAKVEQTFDVAKIVADNRKWTDEFLAKPFRGGDVPTFVDGRREDIDTSRLMVVAFVQDEDPAQDKPAPDKTVPDKTAKPASDAPAGGSQPAAARPATSPVRRILQAAFVKVPPAMKKTTN